MAAIRVEPVRDPQTGRYFLEIYYPSNARRPLVTTAPRYASSAVAENDLIAILAAAANSPVAAET